MNIIEIMDVEISALKDLIEEDYYELEDNLDCDNSYLKTMFDQQDFESSLEEDIKEGRLIIARLGTRSLKTEEHILELVQPGEFLEIETLEYLPIANLVNDKGEVVDRLNLEDLHLPDIDTLKLSARFVGFDKSKSSFDFIASLIFDIYVTGFEDIKPYFKNEEPCDDIYLDYTSLFIKNLIDVFDWCEREMDEESGISYILKSLIFIEKYWSVEKDLRVYGTSISCESDFDYEIKRQLLCKTGMFERRLPDNLAKIHVELARFFSSYGLESHVKPHLQMALMLDPLCIDALLSNAASAKDKKERLKYLKRAYLVCHTMQDLRKIYYHYSALFKSSEENFVQWHLDTYTHCMFNRFEHEVFEDELLESIDELSDGVADWLYSKDLAQEIRQSYYINDLAKTQRNNPLNTDDFRAMEDILHTHKVPIGFSEHVKDVARNRWEEARVKDMFPSKSYLKFILLYGRAYSDDPVC